MQSRKAKLVSESCDESRVRLLVERSRNGSSSLSSNSPLLSKGEKVPVTESLIMAKAKVAKSETEESPKSKKTACPVTREQFHAKAVALPIKIGENLNSGDAREFSSGSLGWYFGDKVTVMIDGVPCKAQVTCSVVLVGSKDLPGGQETESEE
jgi:hypothetical protein